MVVFHGSNIAVSSPKILSTVGRDFGLGFYTTFIREQAEIWARRKAKIASRSGVLSHPVLSIYEYDELLAAKSLEIKNFDEQNMEWLELIMHCRVDVNFRHSYDIVIGGMADDNVGETFAYLLSGVITKDEALKRMKYHKVNNQLCFNTERALTFLHFVGYEEV